MNPIKPTIKTEAMSLLLIFVAVTTSFYFYNNFPEQVPIHWNFAGVADNYGSKFMGAFLFPFIIILMYVMFLTLPFIDPKKERYQEFSKVYHIFKTVFVAFMVVIYFIASLKGLGWNIAIGTWTPILIGLLFMLIGKYMSRIKPNWFMGIRTPWTLSSEKNWKKTHHFSGNVFMLGGLMMIVLPFIPVAYQAWLLGIIIVSLALGTTGYSLLIYLKDKKNGEDKQLK